MDEGQNVRSIMQTINLILINISKLFSSNIYELFIVQTAINTSKTYPQSFEHIIACKGEVLFLGQSSQKKNDFNVCNRVSKCA